MVKKVSTFNISWQNARTIAHRVARYQEHFGCTIRPLDGYSVSCPRKILSNAIKIKEKLKKNKSNLPVKIFLKLLIISIRLNTNIAFSFSLYPIEDFPQEKAHLPCGDLFSLECSSAVQRQGRVIVEVIL